MTGLLPMSAAKKDRTAILLYLRDDLCTWKPGRPDLKNWEGVVFVGHHSGLADDGFDIGWAFSAPVGHGGFTDEWFLGWLPVPSASVLEAGR